MVMKKMMTIEPASARMQKRRSGMIIATEKIVFIGIALLATGIAVGVFQDAIFGVTEFADIQVQNFETQRNGDRLTVTATIKNVGNTPIDSIVLSEFTAGDLAVRQDAETDDGSPVDEYGTVIVTGRDGADTCTTRSTTVDGDEQNMREPATACSPVVAGETIQINGVSRGTVGNTGEVDVTDLRGIDGKGSVVFRMIIVANSGIDITDSVGRNDQTTIAFLYMVGESEQTGKTAYGKVKGS